ncbi:MAG: response regulator transcription factor [Deltaproteobacteria bacterium]|nr:response regulator transcription factor [Deltaproteobacteria bacterium]
MTDAVIRVLVVDDNLLARLGIVSLLKTASGIEVCAEARDGVEALSLYKEARPDVVLLDLNMPRVDGVQVIQALVLESPPGRCVALTQLEGSDDILRALRAGALGYVTKDAAGDQILEAIAAAAQGRKFLPTSVGAKLAEHVMGESLTLRETQVLRALADGHSNRSIASLMRVSERTVATHVASILFKLGVKNRAEAASTALKRHLI